MITTITTNEKNYHLSTTNVRITEISEDRNIRFLKYCSDAYIDRNDLLRFFPEMNDCDFDILKVKITTTLNRIFIMEDEYIPLTQVIESLNNNNKSQLSKCFNGIINAFPKNAGVINQDEIYDYLESWKHNVYDIIGTMESLYCGKINSILRDTYQIMETNYGFDMKEAEKEFLTYKQKYNPSLLDSGINFIAHKEEYRQIFIKSLKERFSRSKKYIELQISAMERNYSKLQDVFNDVK